MYQLAKEAFRIGRDARRRRRRPTAPLSVREFAGAGLGVFAAILGTPAAAQMSPIAQEPTPVVDPTNQEAAGDAWWTGPMLAASADTLPKGHLLAETYLFNEIGPTSSDTGTLTYLLYGFSRRVSAGLIATTGYGRADVGGDSAAPAVGDLTLLAQYRLTRFRPGRWTPTVSLVLQEVLPTGKYDRLGDHAGGGLGAGAYTTVLGLYMQSLIWAPNGRILRPRLDVSYGLPSSAPLKDASVYGTQAGFTGNATPGPYFVFDASVEYSVTQRWVVAADLVYRHSGPTAVSGVYVASAQTPGLLSRVFGSSDGFSVAPAIEYNWTPNVGVLLGVRVNPRSHNASESVTPAIALNYVY